MKKVFGGLLLLNIVLLFISSNFAKTSGFYSLAILTLIIALASNVIYGISLILSDDDGKIEFPKIRFEHHDDDEIDTKKKRK